MSNWTFDATQVIEWQIAVWKFIDRNKLHAFYLYIYIYTFCPSSEICDNLSFLFFHFFNSFPDPRGIFMCDHTIRSWSYRDVLDSFSLVIDDVSTELKLHFLISKKDWGHFVPSNSLIREFGKFIFVSTLIDINRLREYIIRLRIVY